MKILAIDTSTKLCSVSLLKHKQKISYFQICNLNHNKYILYMINKILLKNKVTISKLNAIAYSIGPGSFTGIRIGIGIAKGLSLSRNIPTLGISSLLSMSKETWIKSKKYKILAFIKAQKNKFYCGKYIFNKEGKHKKFFENIFDYRTIQKIIKSNLTNEYCISGANTFPKKYLLNLKKSLIKISSIRYPSSNCMLTIAHKYFKNIKI